MARKLNGKWGGPHRQTLALVEHGHWVRHGKKWRRETEMLSEIDFVQRIAREGKGWYRGARIASISIQSQEVKT
jgi:hypothetical protein